VTNLITIRIDTNVRPHIMIFVNSAQDHHIHRLKKIKYIAKNVTVTVLTKTASITTMMFAKKFINAKTVIK